MLPDEPSGAIIGIVRGIYAVDEIDNLLVATVQTLGVGEVSTIGFVVSMTTDCGVEVVNESCNAETLITVVAPSAATTGIVKGPTCDDFIAVRTSPPEIVTVILSP